MHLCRLVDVPLLASVREFGHIDILRVVRSYEVSVGGDGLQGVRLALWHVGEFLLCLVFLGEKGKQLLLGIRTEVEYLVLHAV